VQKYLSDTVQNKHMKIYISFFPLQENPALLVPWMVYTIVFLIVHTSLTLYFAVGLIEMSLSSTLGAFFIVVAAFLIAGAIVVLCK